MTIYMVQHAFSRPEWEEEWNAWYGGNLKVLLSVPGFRTGQRFRALQTDPPPRYMAVYTVDSPDVFDSKVYKDAGGGGANSARFRPAYEIWIRNLFEGIRTFPDIRAGELLVSVDSPTRNVELPGVRLVWLTSMGFHKSTPYRAIGVVQQEQQASLRGTPDVTVYEPITGQQGPLHPESLNAR